MSCPELEVLVAVLRSRPGAPDEDRLAAHLAGCPGCQDRLEAIAGGAVWNQARARLVRDSPRKDPESLRRVMAALEAGDDVASGDAGELLPCLDFLEPSLRPGFLGRFDGFEVEALVAAGGMGIVLKAWDPGLDRVVALKVLPPALAVKAPARSRFLREARASAAVVHENVVAIHAVDEWKELPYLVMPFIEGCTLAERIRQKGPVPLEGILRIGGAAAAGLAAAHARGLVHRDVKPGNILLEGPAERVKVTDFGLARTVADSSLSHAGHITGTPEYMSPEQARGQPVEARSDLFSLGCVLYEMATGVSPFRAEGPLAALRRVCDEEPVPAHRLNPSLPRWWGEYLGRLMAKDPAARPASAADVASELSRRLAEDPSNGARPGPAAASTPEGRRPGWSGRRAGLSLAGAGMVLLGGAVWWAGSGGNLPSAAAPTPTGGGLSSPFHLPGPAGQEGSGFDELAGAVAAAVPGAVIECRWNGRRAVAPVEIGDKALVLRAGEGFEPVLSGSSPGRPLLATRGPLILEGLTLIAGNGGGESREPRSRRSGLVVVEGGPFLAAHSRLVQEGSEQSPGSGLSLVRMVDVAWAWVLESELASHRAAALDWGFTPDAESPDKVSAVRVEGSRVAGTFLATGRRARAQPHLMLRGNVFAGNALVALFEPHPLHPLRVEAEGNVFEAEILLHRPSFVLPVPLEKLVRWVGTSNAYSLGPPPGGDREVRDFAGWVQHPAVSETGAARLELGIRGRLPAAVEAARFGEAAAFVWTPGEREALRASGFAFPATGGVHPPATGPGKQHDAWRKSASYAAWERGVRDALSGKVGP